MVYHGKWSTLLFENINWRNVAFLRDTFIAVGNESDAAKNFLINDGVVKDSISLGNAETCGI